MAYISRETSDTIVGILITLFLIFIWIIVYHYIRKHPNALNFLGHGAYRGEYEMSA